jgi:5-methylcytosine-specific restriction protein B
LSPKKSFSKNFLFGLPSEKSFKVKNGIFFEFCKKAELEPDQKFFFIIDEINRGNLSKIFGELMMLMEADKRGPDYALQLAYSESPADTFHIPENVHLIGTMNTADRSLAMVDYALRRRFAFIDLAPEFSSPKFKSTLKENGADKGLIDKIVSRMNALNQSIFDDSRNLGRGYRIGHSFFCPSKESTPNEQWYDQVIKYEIAPLIREYWLDDEGRVNTEIDKLQA